MYFTGSKAHNIALRGLANDRGWKLNEYGLLNCLRAHQTPLAIVFWSQQPLVR